MFREHHSVSSKPPSPVMFVAEVVNVTVEDTYMNDTGKFELNESGLVTYSHGEYFLLGEKLGKFGYSVQKKKDRKKR